MNEVRIAQRYARALLEIGAETGELARIVEHLGTFADCYQGSAQLRGVLGNPLVDEQQRLQLVDALCARLGVIDSVRGCLKVLVSRKRMSVLPEVRKIVEKLADERSGVVRATIASAEPLSESQQQRYQEELERLTGKRVMLEKRLDPSLIAGLVAQIGDHVVDSSLRGRVDALQRRLLDDR